MTTPKKGSKKVKAPALEQQAAEMAILPGRPSDRAMKDVKAVLEKKDPDNPAETKALIEMSQMEGWKVLKKKLFERDQNLLAMAREKSRQMTQSVTNFADAGFAFHMYDLMAGADDAIIAFVEGPLKQKAFEHDTPDDADRANNDQ